MEETLAQLFVKNIQEILSQTYQSRGYGGTPTKNGAGTKRVPNTGPGRLASSVEYRIEKDEDGFVEAILILMEDYWEVVDQGRGKNKKFPPPQVIKRWILEKPIAPIPINGKIPTLDQRAFLIGRSIAKKGIQGIDFLNRASDLTIQQGLDQFGEDFADKIQEIVEDKLRIINADQIDYIL